MSRTRLIHRACAARSSRLPEDHLAFVVLGTVATLDLGEFRRVIAGGLHPDHATIARFRARHEKALGALFSQVLRLTSPATRGTAAARSPDSAEGCRKVVTAPGGTTLARPLVITGVDLTRHLPAERREHVEARLRSNLMAWLTTVRPDGQRASVVPGARR